MQRHFQFDTHFVHDWPMLPTILLWIYCGCIVTVSLLGGALPNWIKLTHRRMQFVMSGVGGLMLGVAILHMIPHAVHAVGSVDQCMVAAMIGLLAMFLMIRVFHTTTTIIRTTTTIIRTTTTGIPTDQPRTMFTNLAPARQPRN